MKPLQGSAKVALVQLRRLPAGSWREPRRLVRQASSDGSWVDVGRCSKVSSRSRKEMEMEVEVAAIDVSFASFSLS